MPEDRLAIDGSTLGALGDAVRHPLRDDDDPEAFPIPVALAPLRLDLTVAGLSSRITLQGEELLCGYIPLMRVIWNERARANGRIIVGLAGVPGSGKSTAAAVIERLWWLIQPGPTLVVIGMDGWHRSNTDLDRRTFVNPDGTTLPLRRRKGSPPSFDAEALAVALERIRHARQDVLVPRYDRKLHEPVPEGTVVPGTAGIVLIEGNYLLLDGGPWDEVRRWIDLGLWLDVDPAACRDGIVARHVAGGMSSESARAKYQENDLINTETAMAGRSRAAWLLRAQADHALVTITRNPTQGA